MDTPPTPVAPVDASPDNFDKKWSWGGLMFEQILIIASKRYWYLLLYLLMFIPLVNIIAIAAIKLYFGYKGRSFVKASNAFSNEDEYRGFMKGVDHAGKIVFYIALVILVIALVGVAIAGVAFFSKFGGGFGPYLVK